MRHKHYDRRGCKIFFLRNEQSAKNNFVDIWYCPKHHIEICKCGVEWGKHSDYYDSLK